MQRIQNNSKRILFGLVAGILILLLADFNSRMAELNRLSEEKSRVAVQATANAATKTVLQEKLAFATSEAAVEKWAYEQGRMVRPGDNLIVPLAVGPQPTPVVEAEAPAVVQSQTPWEIWMALFFDRP